MSFSTDNLTIRIGNKTLASELSLQFSAGEIWGILGQNGAGKTTLLHTLAGLYKPAEGVVYLDQKNIYNMNHKQRAQKIGLLPQDCHFSFPATVFDTALIGRYPHQKNWFHYSKADASITQNILERLNLSHLSQRNITELSGGEKRKLMLARLMVQDPEIYLLDEPTNHLDIQQKIQILSRLTHFAKEQNKIVIMILHDIHLLSHFCDHIILFEQDGHVNHGPREVTLNKASLHKLFSHDTLERCANYFD